MPVVTIKDGDGEIKQVLNIEFPNDDNLDRSADLVQGTISGEYVSDKVTSVKTYAFSNCSNLSSVRLPNCTNIGACSFNMCKNLESVDLPMCTIISGNNAFYTAEKLKTLNLPNLTTITNGSRSFMECNSLEEFNAPNLTSIVNTERMFGNCRNIKKIALPKLSGVTISANTFANCYWLDTVILGGEFNALENTNAFSGAGTYTEKGFRIYVPDDLVDTYKTATNWSVYADQIKPMS